MVSAFKSSTAHEIGEGVAVCYIRKGHGHFVGRQIGQRKKGLILAKKLNGQHPVVEMVNLATGTRMKSRLAYPK
jgi:hypothetical protein